MATMPLAEAYEKLKELRRQGVSQSDEVRSIYREVSQRWLTSKEWVRSIDEERVVRFIEIKTLAERVFGDPAKADAWMSRANPGLSGQRTLDLLKDELGAAVVREMLERIDHGIFP